MCAEMAYAERGRIVSDEFDTDQQRAAELPMPYSLRTHSQTTSRLTHAQRQISATNLVVLSVDVLGDLRIRTARRTSAVVADAATAFAVSASAIRQ